MISYDIYVYIYIYVYVCVLLVVCFRMAPTLAGRLRLFHMSRYCIYVLGGDTICIHWAVPIQIHLLPKSLPRCLPITQMDP